MSSPAESFDYIVVGAGSAGCVVANRLSADPSVRVLLLEAGPADSSFWIHLPIGFYRTIFDPRLGWGYVTEPCAGSGGRVHPWARGKVLGGSSSINGLLYVRGQLRDFDDWAAMGCTGWDAAAVLPYFKRSEDNVRGADAFHGVGGPLRVSDHWGGDPLCDALIQAGQEIGIPHNPDFNGARQEGVGYYQFTTRNARRASTAAAYLKPVSDRANLKVVTHALVERVLFDGARRAVGVVYQQAGSLHQAACRGEVVLSGGVINSPQLLQLSGVGPGALLQGNGVPVVHDHASVGRNLQDHYNAYTQVECSQPLTWNVQSRQWRWKIKSALQYLAGSGPFSTGSAKAGAFLKSSPALDRPDLQMHFSLFTTDGKSAELERHSAFTLSVCQLRPRSRGQVEIKSPDPTAAPRIVPNYLVHEEDQRCVVAGLRASRRLAEAAAMRPLVRRIIRPDDGSDEQLLHYAQQTGRTVFHPVGTCRMGSDDAAVVDPQLCVRGVSGLRVADASVMPVVVSGNTNAAAIMIGERAADFLLQARRGG